MPGTADGEGGRIAGTRRGLTDDARAGCEGMSSGSGERTARSCVDRLDQRQGAADGSRTTLTAILKSARLISSSSNDSVHTSARF